MARVSRKPECDYDIDVAGGGAGGVGAALGEARKRDRSIRRDRLESPICLIASRRNIPCPIKISTCRNFEITVSGFGQLFASHGPRCHKYNDGAIQMERFNRLIAA